MLSIYSALYTLNQKGTAHIKTSLFNSLSEMRLIYQHWCNLQCGVIYENVQKRMSVVTFLLFKEHVYQSIGAHKGVLHVVSQ